MNDIELIDEIVKRAEEHQKQKEREFAITELEKVKEEMNNYCDYHAIYDWGLIDLIDEHISKLKGE